MLDEALKVEILPHCSVQDAAFQRRREEGEPYESPHILMGHAAVGGERLDGAVGARKKLRLPKLASRQALQQG